MDQTLARLEALGHRLPEAPAPVGSYLNCVRSGKLLHLSGGLPIDGERRVLGKVPSRVSVEEAQEAARMVILNRLAVILAELGSLDRVARIVSLGGFVNSEPGFHDHPKVINGASDLLVEIFGERGRHVRTAVGVAALPLDVAVEISLVVEVAD